MFVQRAEPLFICIPAIVLTVQHMRLTMYGPAKHYSMFVPFAALSHWWPALAKGHLPVLGQAIAE